MGSTSRRSLLALVCVVAVFTPMLSGLPAGSAAPVPSIRLMAVHSEVTVVERSRGGLGLDPGAWIAATDGDFQIRVSRPDLLSDLTAAQTTTDGTVLREIPIEDVLDWYGLDDFLHVSVKNENGRAVYRNVGSWCPNAWDRDRVDDTGPTNATYPSWCGGGPFTLGTVWGIDQGWAMNPLQWFRVPARDLPAGTYDLRLWIDAEYANLFQVAPEDAEVHVTVQVEPRGTTARPAGARTSASAAPMASVPEIVPAADVRPDIGALPAWGISVLHRKDRDYLAFGATVWNDGPSPMIVEGYRRSGEDVMDGWQYFMDSSGDVIGKAEVGSLEYDARKGHQHWHFEQFANYALTDATQTEVVRSEKMSFCLAPTDPINLTAPNAEWNPYLTDLSSACGEPSSLWVRETLPVGWGDTYFQWLPGQSFDITDLPNGKYFVRVAVNPLGELYDGSSDNDVSYRRVRLRGHPGERWVVVPPYHGIDTEGCPRCFFAAGQPSWDGMPRRWRA